MTSRSRILSASFRLANEGDAHLPAYDNTALVAYNECPTFGVLRYGMHRKPYQGGRAMALEAGSAMHEVFAWVRLCTLDEHAPILAAHHRQRLFGDLRVDAINEAVSSTNPLMRCKEGAIAVLNTSPFYDDPRDRRRTIANMEECAFAYIDRWDWKPPVWIRDQSDPESDVGIEIPFDLVVHTERASGEDTRRYTGKIDGMRVHNGVTVLEENKTAARLNEAWAASMHMRSQITGYCIAASVFTEASVREAHVHGLAIPLPKSYDYGGVIQEHVTREDYHIEKWLEWFAVTADGYEADKDNPHDALRFTHSCNRFFRPCEFLPFCDNNREEQEALLKEYIVDEWSPLHERIET